MDVEKIKEELASRLKPSRYRHSLGVSDTAAFLAKRFGADEEKARIAGLLHDCGREFSVEDMQREADRRGIPCGPVERAMPLLLHAQIGAELIAERYGIRDEEIARAIRRHTVGGPSMTVLDKIIYFADMIEPNRDYDEARELRRLSKKAGLDEMLLEGLSRSIAFVLEKQQPIHPDTVTARNELLFRHA